MECCVFYSTMRCKVEIIFFISNTVCKQSSTAVNFVTYACERGFVDLTTVVTSCDFLSAVYVLVVTLSSVK